jgi:2-amino-4-hydroxy-6-hydroxymethyldihydropteridine diphosphokinase
LPQAAGKHGMKTQRAWIGLGSNLDDPPKQLARAITALARLPGSSLFAVSCCYRNPALCLPGSPPQPDYVNAVAALDTLLAPMALLDAMQAIENAQGRVREQRWGPRTLDLDLLLYGELVLSSPRLTLPHPGMSQRLFVLRPLADIAPDLCLPDGSALRDLLAACPPAMLERLDKPA